MPPCGPGRADGGHVIGNPELRRQILERVAAGVGALALGFGGAASFAFGGCHDSGGFCSGTFSGTHVAFYGVAVVLLSLAAGLLARTVTRRPVVIGGVAGSAALLVLVLIVATE